MADCSWRLNRAALLENDVQAHALPAGDDLVPGALSVHAALESLSKPLSNLSLHTQRLSRQFEKTEKHLRELQKIRRDQQQHDLDQFLDIREMYEDKGETYDHAGDGFVFSEDQIHDRIRARNRERLHDDAVEYWETAA